MNTQKLTGLIAATYTPFHADGSLALSQIGPMVEYLLNSGVQGLYVCGSTGEGMSLTTAERKEVAAAYMNAADGRVPVLVQVGHNSLEDAKSLAAHAQEIGVAAISATCPSYFKIDSAATLATSMAQIAAAAPELPFYYYHIPSLTGSSIDIAQFMRMAGDSIPNLVGLKYTDTKLFEFQECQAIDGGRYDIVWGADEMLLGALASGAQAAIGSTYNVAAPLYANLIAAFEANDLPLARKLQLQSIEFIRIMGRFPFHSATKELLRALGHNLGTCRLPQRGLTQDETNALLDQLSTSAYFSPILAQTARAEV
ncbi:dihydrodipicolinate synthase family protein [Bremerella cremea]|uniref:dihydrodipicolinate synthase family protein n=1 Tax=Bremerella cremea TaxID=1031537 RepID=UPI001F4451F8|nr:dihydrodipicolinate synthase family protein [Bremerella cremea]